MSDYIVIGTCSICDGPVVVPRIWMGMVPPTPHCLRCNATKKGHGPKIEMQPRERQCQLNKE